MVVTRDGYYGYLRGMAEGGFAKRIMFGSDFANQVGPGIDAVRLAIWSKIRSTFPAYDAPTGSRASWSADRPANTEMEPTRLTVCAILSPGRAAHFER
jgi:hypothetical protein